MEIVPRSCVSESIKPETLFRKKGNAPQSKKKTATPPTSPDLKKFLPRQLTATPHQAGCKTSAVRRRKRKKRMAAKMRPKRARHAALTRPRRVAQCAASLPTRPARLRAPRPLSCDADLDGRRDEQNGPAHSLALDGVERNASSRRRRGTKKLQNESRRWRVGGVEVPSRIRAGCRRGGKQPPIDRPGRTCATAASPRRHSSLEQERAQARNQGKVAVERGAQVGAGTGPSGAGEN